MPKRTYGWRKQKPDARDKLFRAPRSLVGLPPTADVSRDMGPVYDQGQLGSCTANAICAALVYDRMKQKGQAWDPSRLFLYYLERYMEGDVNGDNGAEIRDGVKAANATGVCQEKTWPYVEAKYADHPSDAAFSEAANFEAVTYAAIQDGDLNGIKAALASGFPVVFGFTVFASFESDEVARTGIAPMPAPGEAEVGGHAVVIVAYDDDSGRFGVRNSWSSAWGAQGYFTLPYDYVGNPALSSDFWVISSIKDVAPQGAGDKLTLWERFERWIGLA